MLHTKFEKNLPCSFQEEVKNIQLLTHDGPQRSGINCNSHT